MLNNVVHNILFFIFLNDLMCCIMMSDRYSLSPGVSYEIESVNIK